MQEKTKTSLFFVASAVLAVIAIWLTFTMFINLSTFAVAFGKAVLGIFAWFIFDKTVLREIDTITEIKQGNQAHALFILSYAIILAACIASA